MSKKRKKLPALHVRLPRDVHKQLRADAKEHQMSLNALIVLLLSRRRLVWVEQ